MRWSWWHSPSVRPGVYGCRVAAWHLQKGRLHLALAARQGGFQEVLHEGSAGQHTLPQCTSPLQANWPGGKHQQAMAGCQVYQMQQFLLTWQTFALFISTCNHIRDPLDHKGRTGLYKKRQSNFLMYTCPSLAPLSCIQQLYSWYTAMRRGSWDPVSRSHKASGSFTSLPTSFWQTVVWLTTLLGDLKSPLQKQIKKNQNQKRLKLQTFKETHSWDTAKTGMIDHLGNRCIKFAFILLWNIS